MRNFLIIIACGLILISSGVAFYMQQQIVNITQKNSSLLEKNSLLERKLIDLSQQYKELQLQYARQTCIGRWENNTCIPFTTTFNAIPLSGYSPLNVTFTAQVPNMHYAIDFGDGSSSWLSVGPNADSAGKCIPDSSGLCTITVTHTFMSNMNTSFNPKLMKDGAVVSTLTINTMFEN